MAAISKTLILNKRLKRDENYLISTSFPARLEIEIVVGVRRSDESSATRLFGFKQNND